MVNKRFLQTVERWKNPSLPAEINQQTRTTTKSPTTKTNFSNNVSNSFIFSYDGPNGNFAQELISKLKLLPLNIEIHDFLIKEFELMLEKKENNLANEIIKNNVILYFH